MKRPSMKRPSAADEKEESAEEEAPPRKVQKQDPEGLVFCLQCCNVLHIKLYAAGDKPDASVSGVYFYKATKMYAVKLDKKQVFQAGEFLPSVVSLLWIIMLFYLQLFTFRLVARHWMMLRWRNAKKLL